MDDDVTSTSFAEWNKRIHSIQPVVGVSFDFCSDRVNGSFYEGMDEYARDLLFRCTVIRRQLCYT